jgi:hypothetical protein
MTPTQTWLNKLAILNVDAAVDTEADTLINQGVDYHRFRIPGGEMFEQQLRTEVDQVVNNAINNDQ